MMKIAPDEIHTDLCQTSIDILRSRCSDFLCRTFGSRKIWFPDHFAPPDTERDAEEITDVVFFGSFLKRFLESGNWTGRTYRFWTPSSASKVAMEKLLGIPSSKVGVIQRDLLFPRPQKAKVFPSGTESVTFVFAGRISPTKNIEMILRTVYHLQKLNRVPVSLALIGDFDDQIHPDRGRREALDFKTRVLELIEKLDWVSRPRLLPRTNPDEWPKLDFNSPVYINFSTFICEDFDVSLAQAQSQGWPALVTDWGGHRDATGTNIIKIHPLMIGHSHEPDAVIELKAETLAPLLGRMLADLSKPPPLPPHDFSRYPVNLPEPIQQGELDSIRRSFVSRYAPSSHRIYREGLDAFADTREGQQFFSSYRVSFSGPSPQFSTVVFINDLNTNPDDCTPDSTSATVGRIRETCDRVVAERGEAEAIIYVQIREALHPQSLLLISQAEKIVIPFCSVALAPLLTFLVREIDVAAKVVLYSDARLPNALSGILRSRDQILHR